MGTTTWYRDVYTGLGWSSSQQSELLVSIPAGSTLVRTRFNWGMHGSTTTDVHVSEITGNFVCSGIVTTVGNGTESPPSPIGGRADVDPPTKRWVWWEARVPEIVVWDTVHRVAHWRTTPAAEASDSKGMVLATGIPGGDTLNVWFTWQSYAAWDPSGPAQFFLQYSLLVEA